MPFKTLLNKCTDYTYFHYLLYKRLMRTVGQDPMYIITKGYAIVRLLAGTALTVFFGTR